MNTIIGDLMEQCGIREDTTDEVPDSINDTASTIYAQDDLVPLVNTFVAADTISADVLKDEIPTTSLNHMMSSDIAATVLPTENFMGYITVNVPNGIEVHDNDDMQPHIVEASEPVEKGITSYVQVIALTILQSPQQQLLVREIYESITQNWDRYSLNKRTWKTSVRHALSHNTFFIHNGRGPNGRAHYWSIHPSCVSMFKRGDFRRPEAKRRVQIQEREKVLRQEKQVNNSLASRKNISSKSGGNKWVQMQQHQYSYDNRSANMAEPTDFSSSLATCNAQLNQHQCNQHHNYRQQQAQYQHLPQQQKLHQHQQHPQTLLLPQTQQLPQHQQPPHYEQQYQQQLLHQQQYQHSHLSQYQQEQHHQHQPQQQAQQMEHSDCLFGNSQNREFHQPYPCMRSQPENMASSTTGDYPYNNLRSAMDYNSANTPVPSQYTSNTAYYNNTAQQHQQYY